MTYCLRCDSCRCDIPFDQPHIIVSRSDEDCDCYDNDNDDFDAFIHGHQQHMCNMRCLSAWALGKSLEGD